MFAALVEFACLNFLDTLVRRLKRREMERKKYQVIMNQRYCDMPSLNISEHTRQFLSNHFLQKMVFSSLGGLKSCAVGGGRIESEEVHEEVRALLDDNLLSPTHSSGQNSPLTLA